MCLSNHQALRSCVLLLGDVCTRTQETLPWIFPLWSQHSTLLGALIESVQQPCCLSALLSCCSMSALIAGPWCGHLASFPHASPALPIACLKIEQVALSAALQLHLKQVSLFWFQPSSGYFISLRHHSSPEAKASIPQDLLHRDTEVANLLQADLCDPAPAMGLQVSASRVANCLCLPSLLQNYRNGGNKKRKSLLKIKC